MELQLLVSWFVLGFPFGSFGRSDFPSLTGLLSSSTSAASFVAMVIDFYNGYRRDGFCRCSPLCSSKGGYWGCTALISTISRSVEIYSFLVVGVAPVSSSLSYPVAAVMLYFLSDPAVCGGLGLSGSKGPLMPSVFCHRQWRCSDPGSGGANF
ncbi:hypothetical protein QL285_033692 [Trifolium repens]|nr:hypothetical protein QL285_033692 [Trifolium repens]